MRGAGLGARAGTILEVTVLATILVGCYSLSDQAERTALREAEVATAAGQLIRLRELQKELENAPLVRGSWNVQTERRVAMGLWICWIIRLPDPDLRLDIMIGRQRRDNSAPYWKVYLGGGLYPDTTQNLVVGGHRFSTMYGHFGVQRSAEIVEALRRAELFSIERLEERIEYRSDPSGFAELTDRCEQAIGA